MGRRLVSRLYVALSMFVAIVPMSGCVRSGSNVILVPVVASRVGSLCPADHPWAYRQHPEEKEVCVKPIPSVPPKDCPKDTRKVYYDFVERKNVCASLTADNVAKSKKL